MRLVSDVDWPELVESVSLVDETLRAGSGFAEMDFATRNLYRSAIEELARGSPLSELEIARAALRGPGDPGCRLIAAARRGFEKSIGYRAPPASWPGRSAAALGIGGYIGGILVVAAVLLCLPLLALAHLQVGAGWLGLLAALGLVPSLDAAMALVNRGVTRGFGATILPGLALRDGVPAHLRTLVAVPALLTTRAALDEQIERLEIHHLASPEGELYFALLSDWTDAAA